MTINIINEFRVIGRMRMRKGNRNIWRELAPVLHYPLQISHDLTWDRTRTAAVGSRHKVDW
jgi:hypothetical protein